MFMIDFVKKHWLALGLSAAALYLLYQTSKKKVSVPAMASSGGDDANFSNVSGTRRLGYLPPIYYSENSGLAGGTASSKERDGSAFYYNKRPDFINKALQTIGEERAATQAELQSLPPKGGPMTTKKRLQYQLRALDIYEKVIHNMYNK